jgi:hypothetical protein
MKKKERIKCPLQSSNSYLMVADGIPIIQLYVKNYSVIITGTCNLDFAMSAVHIFGRPNLTVDLSYSRKKTWAETRIIRSRVG